MTELISLKQLSKEVKIALLKELDHDSDGDFVLNADGEILLDKYIDEPVKVNNMVILPGSTVILDDNPVSISSYMEEYGDEIIQ